MLREILNALKGTDALGEMLNSIGKMLEAGHWVFRQASEVLMRKADWSHIAESLYERDREINLLEQSVREKILAHLAVGNKTDLAACLIIMSVVKDAERIGDYGKNIFEVGKFYTSEYAHPEYAQPLDDIRQEIEPLFARTREAFVDGDRKLARAVMNTASRLRGRCDLIVRQLLTADSALAADEAVAYVLLARFYKRVSAHLANIASGVVAPVPMLDYCDE